MEPTVLPASDLAGFLLCNTLGVYPSLAASCLRAFTHTALSSVPFLYLVLVKSYLVTTSPGPLDPYRGG